MKMTTLKVIRREKPDIKPDIKIRWMKELVNHRKFCKFSSFVIDGNEIFCDGCYRVLLNFCQFCGSTRVRESKFYFECSICKSISEKKFL
jgi:hypothetical protein